MTPLRPPLPQIAAGFALSLLAALPARPRDAEADARNAAVIDPAAAVIGGLHAR